MRWQHEWRSKQCNWLLGRFVFFLFESESDRIREKSEGESSAPHKIERKEEEKKFMQHHLIECDRYRATFQHQMRWHAPSWPWAPLAARKSLPWTTVTPSFHRPGNSVVRNRHLTTRKLIKSTSFLFTPLPNLGSIFLPSPYHYCYYCILY